MLATLGEYEYTLAGIMLTMLGMVLAAGKVRIYTVPLHGAMLQAPSADR